LDITPTRAGGGVVVEDNLISKKKMELVTRAWKNKMESGTNRS